MANVTMTLAEYNEMKEELDFLKRVVTELTTPVVSDWDLDYCTNNSYDLHVKSNVSDVVRKFLNSQTCNNLPDTLNNLKCRVPEFEFYDPEILCSRYVGPSEEESSDSEN